VDPCASSEHDAVVFWFSVTNRFGSAIPPPYDSVGDIRIRRGDLPSVSTSDELRLSDLLALDDDADRCGLFVPLLVSYRV